MLDNNRPGAEILVKDGNVCLTREDFWSLPQYLESNVRDTKVLKRIISGFKRMYKLLTFVTDWKCRLQTCKGSRPKMCTVFPYFHLLKHKLCTCRSRPLPLLFFQIVLTSSETCVVQFSLDLVLIIVNVMLSI